MRVAIVGGGIAGLASAVFLARDGHSVSIYERMPGVSADGTGILLKPAGLDVLRRLGLADRALAHGSSISRVISRARNGDLLMDLRYGELRPGLEGVGIRRPVLATLLLDAARAAGAQIHFQAGIDAIDERGEQTWLRERIGLHGPFDLTLLCDGVHSRLRERVATGIELRAHERGVFTLVAPCPEGLASDTLVQRLDGMRDAVGLLPIGRGMGETPQVSFFWNAPVAERARLEAAGFDAWCEYVIGFCPEAAPFLHAAGSFDALTFYTTAEVRLRRWHGARTLVIGDAAHALNPLLGLGATMALLDAECLGERLRAGGRNIPAALEAFQAQRTRALAPYARVSRAWSWLEDTGLGAVRRRLFLGLARSFSGVRRRLLAYVCGYAE